MTDPVKLRPYFERIGFAGEPALNLATLRELHRLHAAAIPFENLSPLLGEPVSLEIAALENKLIGRRRGGYCFEQNRLFQHVLESIGFALTPLAARVVWNRDEGIVNPRTHMALLVGIDGETFLCDVGFGGATLTAPLRFEPETIQVTPHEPYRIRNAAGHFSVEVRLGERWRAAYEFDLQPQMPIDYEAMNHFVQTHPSSHFPRVLMAGSTDASGRFTLKNNELRRYEAGRLLERRIVDSAEKLEGVLRDTIRIELPADDRLGPLLARIAATGNE